VRIVGGDDVTVASGDGDDVTVASGDDFSPDSLGHRFHQQSGGVDQPEQYPDSYSYRAGGRSQEGREVGHLRQRVDRAWRADR
jgi:hypothetical protein